MRRKSCIILFLIAFAGCADDGVSPGDEAIFVLEVSGEEFRARVTDPEAVAALEARMQGGVEGVVSGRLAAGDGGFNQPWSWHWEPATVHVADLAIEVCDGRPSMVEEDLTYWLQTVEQYCPWGARVVRRID